MGFDCQLTDVSKFMVSTGNWGIGVKRGEMRYIHQTNLEFRVGACDDNGDNLLKVSINILNISKWSIIEYLENIDRQ